jgi:DNA-binding NarL/FixJ family response regulator/tetratricopeptide (TPR) repeat protein
MPQTAGAEHLVGRAAELASLDHVLAELDQGLSAAVEIVGEPGIGKTRMLAELSVRADARRQLVLSGSASELERDLPFWVFVDALDEYVQGLELDRLDSLDEDVRTELAHVFPSLSALAGGGDGVALQHERYRTHRAVRALLELLAASMPLVLVLDDLQWADSGSVELLGALLHRPPDAAVLMALAVRPGRVPERLSAALERARRAGILTRIELATLTRGEAREFLGDAIDDAAAAALYEESGGNPFYLEQLARSLDRGLPAPPAFADISPAAVEVPPPVAAALAQELDLLSDGARLVLEGAAFAGDPFEPELAAAAADTPEPTAMAALDELLRFDLVRHTDVPRRFRFRHPLVRRVVYESTPGGWRLGAHERSAQALALRGAPAAARAHHVERSGRKGDTTAVAILREAGEATAHRAPASAARWFAAALRLVPEDAPAEERMELLLARAGSLAAIGQFSDSHAALLESIALLPDDSVALRVRLTTACAGIEHLLGRHEQAHARLASALEALEDPGSPEAVSLLIELATDGFYRMEYETMRESAARALSAARPLGDQPLIAAAAAALAYAGALTGEITEAEMHRSEAAALVDALPDDELALRLDAAVNLSAAEIDLERLVEAEAHAERALVVGRATGQSAVVPLLVLALGWVRRLRGQLTEADELFDGAVEGARLSGNALSLAGNLLNRSLTALAAGDVETALAAAEESVDLTRPLDQSLMSASAGLALAAALLESGNPARAVDVLLEPSGGEELTLVPGAWKTNWLELLTRCWLALGRLEEAKRSATRAEACAAARGLRLAAGMADRAAAAVAFEAGDPVLAAKRALASAAAADEVGVPVEAALSRTLAGRALARAGRLEPATAELQRAAAQFDAYGAVRYRDQAEHELRGLGQHIHRRTRPGSAQGGVDSLTERELQVARLVVDRKTNPEIAAELFVSQKTVETHLRNIFRKLDVSSRVQVAQAVERADRAERSRLVRPE